MKGGTRSSGLPKPVDLTSEEMRQALEEPVQRHPRFGQGGARDHAARAGLGHQVDRGILMVGSAAARCYAAWASGSRRRTNRCPPAWPNRPLTCVAPGSGRALDGFETTIAPTATHASFSRSRRRR